MRDYLLREIEILDKYGCVRAVNIAAVLLFMTEHHVLRKKFGNTGNVTRSLNKMLTICCSSLANHTQHKNFHCAIEMEEENIKLSVTETKLLVRCRLDLEDEFVSGRKKKSVLWGKVLDKMKTDAPDLSPTRDQLQRKFLNMVATYKRIKKRNKCTGRDATTWEFFNEFDEVYGSRHSISPPSRNKNVKYQQPSYWSF